MNKRVATILGALVALACVSLYFFTHKPQTKTHVNKTGNLKFTPGTAQNYYTTAFPVVENPISETNAWVNGLTTGVHWGDMQSFAGGHVGATNTSPGCTVSQPNNCNDSVAALTGTWTANQAVCWTVFIDPTLNRSSTVDEVEVHLHRTIVSGNSTGYEFTYSVLNNGQQYADIVRWDGYISGTNHFTIISSLAPGVPQILNNGDLQCASSIGGVLTGWVSRAGTVIQTIGPVTDTTYAGGAPGIGAENGLGPLSDNAKFGGSNFTAANLYAKTTGFTDVNNLVTGGLHTALDGESLAIPPGTATWTNPGLQVPANIGLQIIGSGSVTPASCAVGGPGTCITLTETSNIVMLSMKPTLGNATSRISSITFIPTTPYCTGAPAVCGNGGGVNAPISVNGTGGSGGHPNLRLDHNYVPSAWANNGISDDTFANVTNMFGVADHNTVGDAAPGSNGVDFINVGHGQWLGVSAYGDNSYATADTFGTAQAFYLEDNTFGASSAQPGPAIGTDTDVNGINGGGGRFVCRFNTWNAISSGGACTGHGTDTTQRVRGVRQWEAYWNTLICLSTTTGCGSAWPGRSGVGISAANIFSNGVAGAFVKGIATLDTQRKWRADVPWAGADGSQPWDTNDAAGPFFSGTILTATTGGPGWTITVSGTPWTTNQWVSNGTPYSIRDTVANGGAEIQSNTTNSLVVIVPDTSHGTAFAAGHAFQITRVLVALDQSTRGAGVLLNGNLNSPAPVGPVNELLDPTYEADDTMPSTASATIGANTASLIQNRDFYVEAVRQAANGNCNGVGCTPFNGTSGSGHGLFSNKPNCTSGPACLVNVGYWATDCPGASGCAGTSWNQSTGANAGKIGQLFIWNGSAWVLKYTPFTYPHPLVSGLAPAGSVSIAPSIENFGNTNVGAFSSAQTATLTNGTSSAITLLSATITGANASDFSIGANNCNSGSVPGNGGTCSVTIQLAPLSLGAKSATLNVSTSAGVFPVSLSGNGVSVIVAPTSLAFGTVTQGGTSATQTTTITNNSTGAITITSITDTGPNAGDFNETNNCLGNLSNGGTPCNIGVTFSPTAAPGTNESATVTISFTGAGSQSPLAVTLTGTSGTPGNVTVAPPTLAFGSIVVGTGQSASQTVTVTNNSGITVTVTTITFASSGSGAGTNFFSPSATCPSTLPNLGTCTVSVAFLPVTAGTFSDTLRISFTGAPGSPLQVSLSGTGLPSGTPGQVVSRTMIAGLVILNGRVLMP